MWTKIEVGSEPSVLYLGADYLDSFTAVAAGRQFVDGVISMTTNRGYDWTVTIIEGTPLSDVACLPYSVYCVVVAPSGDILVTSDSGKPLFWSDKCEF